MGRLEKMKIKNGKNSEKKKIMSIKKINKKLSK